jgi:putative DNA methylase
MPLVHSWWLGKKKGKEAWIRPIICADTGHPSGKRVNFEIGHGATGAPTRDDDGTVGRSGARCVACGSAVELKYVRAEGRAKRLGSRLMAIAAQGTRQRVYLSPTPDQIAAAEVPRVVNPPEGDIPANPRDFKTPNYGLTEFSELFTNRQLLALTTISDLVVEARERVVQDATAPAASARAPAPVTTADAEAYGDAVATYLGMAMSRTLNKSTAICSWDSSPKMEAVRGLFARQALPMAWDYAEANVFGSSSGNYSEDVGWVDRVLERLPIGIDRNVQATQADAASIDTQGALLSTDPPYYDNISFADLSDFFYVWLRRSLRGVYPDLLSTMLVPKAEELVANPYRHAGRDGARAFFEDGFRRVFARARETAIDDYPITVYYAFKQSEAGDDGDVSPGWETLLDGMIRSGWMITATWPMRSELSNRILSQGANALASSIVLALRPRPDSAPTTDRRGLIAALQQELPDALRNLQQGTIAPVDLPQAAIGPGMAVFSRYAKVIENDGTAMTVRSALTRINEILDQVLNEQEGDFDAATRFGVAWYRQHGYTTGKYGVADDLARARNTAVDAMARDGILTSAAGKVTLLSPAALSEDYDVLADDRVGAWEILHHLIACLERDGVPSAGAFLANAQGRPDGAVDAEVVKELAFLLFSIAEKNGWTADALAFNTVATAWPDIVQSSRELESGGEQAELVFEES